MANGGEDLGGQGWIQSGFTLCHPLDHSQQLFGVGIFEQVAFDPGLNRIQQMLILAMHGQHDDHDRWMTICQLACYGNAIQIRHLDVEQDNIWLQRINLR